jgi:hypothetical protein
MALRGSHADRPSRLVMARSRGAITGPLLMLLGAWGALVPFIGHRFGYGYTPDNLWTWTAARGWLEVLPGCAAFLGGALVATSAHRVSATLGGWLAAAGGAWFVLGTVVAPFWNAGNIGVPSGTGHHTAYEQIGMFTGLGVVIVLMAAIAIGRVSVVGVRDVSVAQARIDREADVVDDDEVEPTTTSRYPVERPTRTVELPDADVRDADADNTAATSGQTTTGETQRQTTSAGSAPM